MITWGPQRTNQQCLKFEHRILARFIFDTKLVSTRSITHTSNFFQIFFTESHRQTGFGRKAFQVTYERVSTTLCHAYKEASRFESNRNYSVGRYGLCLKPPSGRLCDETDQSATAFLGSGRVWATTVGNKSVADFLRPECNCDDI